MSGSNLKLILYTSRLTASAAARLADTMEDILVVSQRLNGWDDITGFLWSDGFSFAQVIEGPPRPMDQLYTRISADPRHRTLKLHIDTPIAVRGFPRWSMCGVTLSALDDLLLSPGTLPHDVYDFPAEALLALLGRIAKIHGAQLDTAHHDLVALAPDLDD